MFIIITHVMETLNEAMGFEPTYKATLFYDICDSLQE